MANFPVFIIGTRAQLIKLAPVVVSFERRQLPVFLLMTGQHKETMQDLIEEFEIRTNPVALLPPVERSTVTALVRWLPSAYLALRRQLHELAREHSNLDVIVHGDTLSTVIGAFAARFAAARVVHLESGLSSGKLFNPFPEELSRRIVFHLTDVAMCPNETAASYMRRQHHCVVVNTSGNTILDAIVLVGEDTIRRDLQPAYLVASIHRFQNIYHRARLQDLVKLLEDAASIYSTHFVLHPATRKRLIKEGLLERLAANPRITLSPRLGYGDFLRLAAGAACVLTDGGSNQEELAALGIPTVIMRKATERPDGLGSNAIMEADVLQGMRTFLLKGHFRKLATRSKGPDMDGIGASDRVVDALITGVASDGRQSSSLR